MRSTVSAPLFSVRHYPGVLMVELQSERLDEANAGHLAECLLDLLRHSNAGTLYLNFRSVRAVAPQVWHELISLNALLPETGGRLCVLNLAPALSHQLHAEEHPELAATGG